MAKPITGKTHVGERREKRPNGDIYVYERITAYHKKAKKTYTVSQKLKVKSSREPKKLCRLVRKNVLEIESLQMQHVCIPASQIFWNGLVKKEKTSSRNQRKRK